MNFQRFEGWRYRWLVLTISCTFLSADLRSAADIALIDSSICSDVPGGLVRSLNAYGQSLEHKLDDHILRQHHLGIHVAWNWIGSLQWYF
ncbi:MAG: hypothetical protein CM1200mP6_03220 [Anaerolineaceae bacterium]|nr:MAG: hypothetical protein CM1200mP6_03220 [Anaerolineaceae bacterium]